MKPKHFTYLLVFAMLLWGGGWTALKILTEELPMEIIVFWRFFFMSIAFLPILYFLKQPLHVNTSNLKYILSSSVLNVVFMVSSFYGVKNGLAGSGGVIITTISPILTFLLVALIFKKRLQNIQYFGLFVGAIGGAILLQVNDFSLFFNGSNSYFLLCALAWGGVTLLAQHSQKHIHPIHYSFLISVVATLISFFYAFDANLSLVFEQSTEFWIALIYLAIFGQTIATTIFFIASGKLGSEKTSSFMFLVPLFALLSASIILGEPIENHILLGGIVSVLAVYFINKQKSDD